MLSVFFSNKKDISYTTIKYAKFDFIKRRYQTELERIKKYYREKERVVDNRNILSRLLKSGPSIELDDIDYFRFAKSSEMYISKQFNIISNIHKGCVLHNTLYNGSSEIFLQNKTTMDPFSLQEDWWNYNPIKVIYTEDTDLNMSHPQNIDYENRLYILTIDITGLFLQYRKWAKDRILKNMSTDSNVFVYQIVLTNLIGDILDYNLYNRFNSLFKKERTDEIIQKHPFVILDYSKGIDTIYKKIIKNLYDTSTVIDQLYKTIPVISKDTVKDVLYIEHQIYTVQSIWVLWLSRLDVILNTILFLHKKGFRRNTDLIYDLRYTLKQFNRNNTKFSNRCLDPNRVYELDEKIKKVLKVIYN